DGGGARARQHRRLRGVGALGQPRPGGGPKHQGAEGPGEHPRAGRLHLHEPRLDQEESGAGRRLHAGPGGGDRPHQQGPQASRQGRVGLSQEPRSADGRAAHDQAPLRDGPGRFHREPVPAGRDTAEAAGQAHQAPRPGRVRLSRPPEKGPAEERQLQAVMRRRSLSQSPGRVFYGWWIVAIGCVQDAVKGGLFNTGFTLYFLPVLTDLNLSRAATSLPFSLSRLEAALGAPFVGYLIDRFDVRVMLVAGTLLAGLGLILLSLTHSYLLFLLVFIGPLSFGFQAGFNQATLAVVAHWFRRKRGLAMAIVQTGQAIGGVLIFPLVALAVLKLGWRTAAVLSGLAVLTLLPLVLFIRRSPESMGLLPDGDRSPAQGQHASPSGLTPPLDDTREFTTREALRTPTFWLLAAFHGLRNVPYAGVTVHLVPLLVWKGLDEPAAAFYVGLTALATVVSRPLTGWLGDRQSKQMIGAVGVLLGAAGLAVLAYGDGAWWAL